MIPIGIVSDTHGLLRPEVFAALDGVEHILHAGDVGSPEILVELEAIAPVTAVWGNTDGFDVRDRVVGQARLELGGVSIVVTHGHELGSPTPQELVESHPDAGLIVFGHTHQPLVERLGGTLVVNPGSAGPRRFHLPVTLARATVEDGAAEAKLIHLLDDR